MREVPRAAGRSADPGTGRRNRRRTRLAAVDGLQQLPRGRAPRAGRRGTCERCHAVDAPKFQPARFSHDAGAFPLTGKHATTPCAKCHPSQTAAFPSGTGTAKRLRPVSAECRTCHQDPHLGQVEGTCARCHTPATFKVATFQHVGLEYLFGVATHSRLPCRSCHKTETGRFPAGVGTAMRLKRGQDLPRLPPVT